VVDQLEVGDAVASAAFSDHRAVTVLEPRDGGQLPLIVLPYSSYNRDYCDMEASFSLIEIADDALVQRGGLRLQRGTEVLRTLQLGNSLATISDMELLSIDIDDLDDPRVQSRVTVGDPEQTEQSACYAGDDLDASSYPCSCNIGSGDSRPPFALLLLLLGFSRRVTRRRARRP
jgi:MYXO-CTERM domain-containing protein